MPDLARRHQSKQGPCRLRGGGGGALESLVVEPVTGGILAPATVRVLDRQQPLDRLADRGVLLVHPCGVERAQHRPGAVDIVQPPAAVPRPLRKLGPAQICDRGRQRLAVLAGRTELSQHRAAAGGDVFGRRVEHRAVIGERNVVEVIFEIVDVEGGPAAIATLHTLDPFAAAGDRNIVFLALAGAPGAIHGHHHHGGVVEVRVIGIVVLKGPAAGANLRPLHGPVAFDIKGDWAVKRPEVRPGGWAFQYNNAYYPDLDDTAVVVMAMDRTRRASQGQEYDVAIARGREWIEGMQSRDGGWAAFDVNNLEYYLNNIPFSDHGAMLDPPTEDVTARCCSMLAQLGATGQNSEALAAAVAYLRRTQLAEGSWYGRWGLNYIYGTWSVLCALNAAGVDHQDPVMRKAVDWLLSIQNKDGGWGEDATSYRLDHSGFAGDPTTASHTAS